MGVINEAGGAGIKACLATRSSAMGNDKGTRDH